MERRGRVLDAGIDLLAGQVPTDVGTLSELPDALVGALTPDGSDDDIAILIARVVEDSAQRTAELQLSPTAAAVPEARHFTAARLSEWSLPASVADDAVLIVSELVTNAFVHGRPPIALRLRQTPYELAIEVDDGDSTMPRKLRAGPEDLHGRGVALVARISNRWAARATENGKTVWSTLALTSATTNRAGAADRWDAGEEP